MKILVTGAYGQLGNELKELAVHYPKWQFLYTDLDTLDVSNENEVQLFFRENKLDFVINCAAYTSVDKAETEKITARKINAEAPGILANAAEIYNAKIVHISTDYVFDGNASKPYVETDEVTPTGVYGRTKLEGEQNCLKENPHAVIIRTSWLYSSFGNNFVKTMLRLGRERDFVNVVSDQVGTPTYAADLAKAILFVAEIAETRPEKMVPGIYHFSNEGAISWFEFAKAVFEISKLNCVVKPVSSSEFPTIAKRPGYSVLNKSKIRNTFGIQITDWKDSLKICLEKLEK